MSLPIEFLRFLKNVSLFEGLTDDQLKKIMSICELKDYKAGDYIIRQGAMATEIFILYDGECKVITGEENPQEIYVIKPTEIFGEIGFIDRFPRTASVVATKDSKVISLKKSKFNLIRETEPQITAKIFENFAYILAKRIRKTDEMLARALLNI